MVVTKLFTFSHVLNFVGKIYSVISETKGFGVLCYNLLENAFSAVATLSVFVVVAFNVLSFIACIFQHITIIYYSSLTFLYHEH